MIFHHGKLQIAAFHQLKKIKIQDETSQEVTHPSRVQGKQIQASFPLFERIVSSRHINK